MQYKDVVVMLRRLHASMFYAPFLPCMSLLSLSRVLDLIEGACRRPLMP